MYRVLAVTGKDLKLLLRDKAALFWVLLFPLLIGTVFGSIFGGGGAQGASKILLVDEDQSTESKAFFGRLRKSSALEAQDAALSDAANRVRRGEVAGYVRVGKGFGEAQRQFKPDAAPIQVGMDPARKAEAGILQGVIAEAAFAGLQDLFSSGNNSDQAINGYLDEVNQAQGMDPVQRQSLQRFLGELKRFQHSGASSAGASTGGKGKPGTGGAGGFQGPKIVYQSITRKNDQPATSYEVTFPQALIWGIFGVVTSFAVSLVKERGKGTLLRLRVSPMSFGEILVGKGLACFVACTGVMALLLEVGHLLFHIRLGSLGLLALAIFASSVCYVGIMMLLSVLGKTEEAVSGSASGVLILLSMFGGGMIPLFMMPPWMKSVSAISPFKWSMLAVEGAIWRGFTPGEMMMPVGVLMGIGIVCFGIGVRMFSLDRE